MWYKSLIKFNAFSPAFYMDFMLLSCHVQVSEWIHTLQFVWMSRNSLLKCLKCLNIWSLSHSNAIRTHKYLVRKRTLNYLAKLVKSNRDTIT